MNTIMTVRGPIKPEELGFTSMHEHVLSRLTATIPAIAANLEIPENRFPPPAGSKIKMEDLSYYRCGYFVISEDCRDTDDEALMEAEVREYKQAGGSAMLDCSAPGIRPNIKGVKRISEKTGVHVIASTGLYAEEYWPDQFKEMSVAQLTDYIRTEITEGMEGTDIRAGHIKAAVNAITERQMNYLNAAVAGVNETGASLTTHMGFKTRIDDSRHVWRHMKAAGMPAERLLFCHFQQYVQTFQLKKLVQDPNAWRPQLDYAKEVLDQGINISLDAIGLPWSLEHSGLVSPSDAYHLAAIVELVEQGYEDQIVIGTDIYLKLMTRRYGGHGYVRLLNYFVPTLRELGVSETAIQKITVDNPIRILSM